jgi:two-component system phosphate regulon response regulator PhoB
LGENGVAKETILVVDDESDILELVRYNLTRNGYGVVCAATGEEALRLGRVNPPDLIVLDLMLPGIDGLEVCRLLRQDARTSHVPIVMLTACGEEADVVAGLELGADDYVTKPFSLRVLSARVKAVLRRKSVEQPGEAATLSVHGIVVNPGRHEVLVHGKPADLTHTEFLILHLLARRPGWVFTRQQIIDNARGQVAVTDRSVDVHIVSLRRKLDPCGDCIETVRGVGYRFKE